MADESSTHRSDPLADLISLAAGPIAAVIRSFDQLRRGSEELIQRRRELQHDDDDAERDRGAGQPLAQRRRGAGAGDDPADHAHGAAWPTRCRSSWPAPIDQVAPGLNRLADTLERADHHLVPDRPRRRSSTRSTTSSVGSPRSARSPSRPAGCSGCASPGMTRPATSPAAAMAPFMVAPPPPAATPAPHDREGAGQEGSGEEGAGRRRRRQGAAARRRRPSAPDRVWPMRQRRRTNGVATIVPASAVPRTSIVTGVPALDRRAARSRGRCRGRAPARSSRSSRRRPSRRRRGSGTRRAGGRRPSVAMPTRWRCTPRSRSAASAARPRKVALPHATTHPSPACSGVMPGPSSWPCSGSAGLEAQRVAGAEARPERSRRSSRPPTPTRPRRPGRRSRRRARRCSRCRRPCTACPPSSPPRRRKRPTAAASRPHRRQPLGRLRPLHREHGARRAWCRRRRWPRRTRSVFDAFGITSNTAGPSPSAGCHHTMMSSSTDASASSSRWVYCARPGAILPRSLVSVRCSWSWASAPSRRTVPRCDTSNTTAASRQARCSAIVPPRYSSGMSQPPNGTMRAPRLRWTESSGERSGVIPRRGR